ncbi:MAG TPA: hypothetical protein VFX27_10630 [Sphingobium sp.]|nr:hypothetical protein [Sphingobium sp.]
MKIRDVKIPEASALYLRFAVVPAPRLELQIAFEAMNAGRAGAMLCLRRASSGYVVPPRQGAIVTQSCRKYE